MNATCCCECHQNGNVLSGWIEIRKTEVFFVLGFFTVDGAAVVIPNMVIFYVI